MNDLPTRRSGSEDLPWWLSEEVLSILTSWPGWSAGGTWRSWRLAPPASWTSAWEMRRSLHFLTWPGGGEEPLQSEATLCGNQTQLTQHSQFTNKKHLQLRFVFGESEGLGERRGFQLTISLSEASASRSRLDWSSPSRQPYDDYFDVFENMKYQDGLL